MDGKPGSSNTWGELQSCRSSYRDSGFLTVTAKPTNESFTANDWLQIHVLSYTNMYA